MIPVKINRFLAKSTDSDPNQQISKKLNGQIMPNLILINQDATVRWRHQGYMPGEELEIKDQIQSLLSLEN